MFIRALTQPFACTMGVHYAPPPREPAGPIVAVCPCCNKVIYYYGLTALGVVKSYPTLTQTTFPRVLGPVSALPAPA